MATKACCRTCKHCLSGQVALYSLCRLRKIRIHPDMASFALCHHWTQCAPSLPSLKEQAIESVLDKQLDFGRELVSKDI